MKKSKFILGVVIAVILTFLVFLNDVVIIKFIESLRNYYLELIVGKELLDMAM